MEQPLWQHNFWIWGAARSGRLCGRHSVLWQASSQGPQGCPLCLLIIFQTSLESKPIQPVIIKFPWWCNLLHSCLGQPLSASHHHPSWCGLPRASLHPLLCESTLFLQNQLLHNFYITKQFLNQMYHGQVMVDQERIPQLLQTAQLLEVRGLCEIQNKDGDTVTDTNNRKSFLAGLLNTSKKRSSSIISAESNSSPPPSTSNKRQKTSSSSASNSARPVPMLQSILSQQLAVPNTPTFDLGVGRSTRALSALASKVQANKSGAALPTSLENLLSGSSSVNNNGGPDIHSTASSCSSDDGRDRLIIVGETSSASFGELLDRTGSSRGEGIFLFKAFPLNLLLNIRKFL